MLDATKVLNRFNSRHRRLDAKAKTNLGQKNVKNYPVQDQLWEHMKENEREVVLQPRAYKDEIDWLLKAEKFAVAALIEHHEKERKDLLEAWRFSMKESHNVLRNAGRRLDRAICKRKKLGRRAGIRQHRKVGGGNLIKKPARQPK